MFLKKGTKRGYQNPDIIRPQKNVNLFALCIVAFSSPFMIKLCKCSNCISFLYMYISRNAIKVFQHNGKDAESRP